ncbi:MAG: FtsX-like permease family protein [Rectinemataceae bacterium]|jgi:ABC-type lipoprotein release transport system permease subunit
MLIIKLALRNLGRNARRTRTIGLIIAGILCLMTLGNAILDGTDRGVRRAFIESFTADLSVSAATGAEFSLFGDDSPIVGGFSSVPTIPEGGAIAKELAARPQVAAAVPIVCGQAALEVGSYREPVNAFGIDGPDYFKSFNALSIAKGVPIDGRSPGIMITEARAAAIAQTTGKALELGDPIQLTEVSSEGFQIRRAPLVGLIRYQLQNDTLDSLVIVDASTLRSLLGMSLGVERGQVSSGKDAPMNAASLDSLFTAAEDRIAAPQAGIELAEVEKQLKEELAKSDPLRLESSAVNFVLIALRPGMDPGKFSKELQRDYDVAGSKFRVLDWRHTAGFSALYVYWIRIIFNIGFFIAIFGGMLIIINALVISVIERTSEIGTMRALGATKGFVRRLFFTETMILMLAYGLAGIALGGVASLILGRSGIRVSNQFMATLFGSHTLEPAFTAGGVLYHVAIAALIGAVGWVYPVRLALRIQPVRAIAAE